MQAAEPGVIKVGRHLLVDTTKIYSPLPDIKFRFMKSVVKTRT
jgi:hypothetical protein